MKVLSVDGLSKLISLMKEDFALSSSLSTVATSGDYNDLSNKPTIPTVDQTYSSSSTSINALSHKAIANAKFLQNTATVLTSLTLLGTPTNKLNAINIGGSSSVSDIAGIAIGGASTAASYGISIGYSAYGSNLGSVALGSFSYATAIGAIQLAAIGNNQNVNATNSEAGSFYVALYDGNSTSGNYKLLGANGKIPDDRLNTTIARTSQIPTTVSELTDASNYVTTNTAQNITAVKTFVGEKRIYFKQSSATDKLGFTLTNSNNTELATFEYRPNTVDTKALLSVAADDDYVGFRYWYGGGCNIIAPRPNTAANYYIPVNITDGSTTVTANDKGTVNISSLLPSALPSQTDNSGKYLTTNGTTASWGTITIPTVDQTYSSNSTSTNALSHKAIADAKFIQNTATGLNSTTIEGIATSQALSVNIGKTSIANSQGAVAIGSSASVNVLSNYGIAIGCSSITNGAYAIQLGKGTNSEANSLYIGLSDSNNYKLLGSDGKIPSGRLQIATSVSSSSTNDETVGAKLFYDTVGDIESALHTINSGS